MPVKRELDLTDDDESADEKPDFDPPSTPPSLSNKGLGTPKAPKPKMTSSSNPSTPKSSPKRPRITPATPKSLPNGNGTSGGNGGMLSARAQYAVLIIDKGIEALSKAEVESVTGLTANQQREMTRKDHKGALRKALIATAESL
ncbi:hypothetical protein IAT40_000649 [Kwoniella sp. CBS 6097]